MDGERARRGRGEGAWDSRLTAVRTVESRAVEIGSASLGEGTKLCHSTVFDRSNAVAE